MGQNAPPSIGLRCGLVGFGGDAFGDGVVFIGFEWRGGSALLAAWELCKCSKAWEGSELCAHRVLELF
jgi:hypothetical protein